MARFLLGSERTNVSTNCALGSLDTNPTEDMSIGKHEF
jgi:hypothetical protein